MNDKKMATNVVLTGFMGTGKSSVGRRLAEKLGFRFVDLDDIIEKEADSGIKEIFASRGEAYFRELEAAAIERLTKGAFGWITPSGSGIVVATGGGAVMRPSNRDALKGWGTVVCLRASVDEILKRVGAGDERPLLDVGDMRERIEALLKERDTAYRDCAVTIGTTAKTVEQVVEEIMSVL